MNYIVKTYINMKINFIKEKIYCKNCKYYIDCYLSTYSCGCGKMVEKEYHNKQSGIERTVNVYPGDIPIKDIYSAYDRMTFLNKHNNCKYYKKKWYLFFK